MELKRYCDNAPVNMTVSWFAAKAASDGIDFKFTGNVAPKSQESNNAVVISCENSFDGVLKYDDDRKLMTMKEGSGHGMDLKSVYNIAEKSGGYVEIRNTPDEFIINAVINTSAQ